MIERKVIQDLQEQVKDLKQQIEIIKNVDIDNIKDRLCRLEGKY